MYRHVSLYIVCRWITWTCWSRSGTRASIVYITRIAWWCHERNLILMNHELFTGDAPISVTAHVWYHVVSADRAGPTCWWSYWWHQWAHNNWSGSTKRSVTDCPLRGARVAYDTEPVRERIHDTSIFIDTYQFVRTLIWQGPVCLWQCMCFLIGWVDLISWIETSTSAGAFVYIFTIADLFLLSSRIYAVAFFNNKRVSQDVRILGQTCLQLLKFHYTNKIHCSLI